MKLPISMWSGATSCSQPCRRSAPLTVMQVGADALDVGAHLDEHAREVLDVRLAGGVADHGRARGQRGGHQRVLGGHHRGLVHEDVGRPQPARRRSSTISRPHSTTAPIARKRVEVRVQAAAADHVAARRRHHGAAGSGRAAGRRAGTTRGSARPARGSTSTCVDRGGAQRDLVGAAPVHVDAERRVRMLSIASTSRIRGTLRTTTSSSVRTVEARIGQRAVLVPGREPSCRTAGRRLR